ITLSALASTFGGIGTLTALSLQLHTEDSLASGSGTPIHSVPSNPSYEISAGRPSRVEDGRLPRCRTFVRAAAGPRCVHLLAGASSTESSCLFTFSINGPVTVRNSRLTSALSSEAREVSFVEEVAVP